MLQKSTEADGLANFSPVKEKIIAATTTAVSLQSAPISPDWILSGSPEARSTLLAKSEDRTSYTMVWECSPGSFRWQYIEDETIVILEGEVFISVGRTGERQLRPGDVAFFPAGSSCVWRVTKRVKKVAVLRKALPFPLGLAVRAWYKILRATKVIGHSPLMISFSLFANSEFSDAFLS